MSPGSTLNSSKIVCRNMVRIYMPWRSAAAINSADQIVKFERDREREESARLPPHRRRCLKRGFYSGPGTNPAARMVGIVALGRLDNHNLTGRFNEPYARRIPPVPSSDGHLIIRDTPERWTIYPHQRYYVLLSLLSPFVVHPYTSHRFRSRPHPRQGFAMPTLSILE